MASQASIQEDIYILIVDDEADLVDVSSQLLQSWNYKTLKATSGQEALSILQQSGPRIALVISDYRMPKMNGFELRQAMNDKWKSIPFVILSGHTTREEALKAVELKISAFLQKPVSPHDLKSCIETESKDRVNTIKEEDELLKGFIEEAKGNLELLEPLIFELESKPHDLDIVNRIFGVVHTMKGASGFFQPLTLHHFVHKFEDLLSLIKNGSQTVNGSVISTILKAVALLGTLVEELATGRHESQLEEVLEILRIKEESNSPPSSDKSSSKQITDDSKAMDLKKDLRVPFEMLDEFMQASGEMTVVRNMIEKVVRSIEKKSPGNKDIQLLSDLVGKTHKINSHIQSKIIEIRKMPMKSITRSFPRIIRDVSQKLQKDIDLVTIGDDLRIDTAVGDALNSSLIHMIRNSLDHGIETREERAKSGKSTRGKITIESRLSGDDIIITMSDDGRGISVPKIKEKLLRNGMSSQQIDQMPNSQVLMQIFEPGFSTAVAVTEVSGRGIGMDMVKTSIQSLKGNISIQTELGQGTTFTIKIPTPKSVLIVNSLLVRCGEVRICIQQDHISKLLEIEKTKNNCLCDLEGGQVLKLFDHLIPYLDLRKLVNMPAEENEKLQVVVIKTPENVEFALGVDEILDIEDTVIKSLPNPIRNIDMFAGVTLLGDGSVSLILSPDGLAKKLHLSMPEIKAKQSLQDLSSEDQSFIIFELEDTEGLYAIPQKQINRFEKILAQDIQISGNQHVIPYHGKILSLFELTDLLKLPQKKQRALAEYITLVVSYETRTIGLTVKSIVDIATVQVQIESDIRGAKGLMGAFTFNHQTVSLVDVASLFAA